MDLIKYLLSQTPRVLMGIFLFCVLAILFPTILLNKMGLLQLRNEYNAVLWVALALSLLLLISHSLFVLFPKVISLITRLSRGRKAKQRLHRLTSDEKELFREYIETDTRIKAFSIYSGIVKDLEMVGILYVPTVFARPEDNTYDVNISHWVWDYLKKHPELLKNDT